MNRLIKRNSDGKIAPADDRTEFLSVGDVLWVERSDRCEQVGVVIATTVGHDMATGRLELQDWRAVFL